jgi:hypothetical protein
MKRNLHVLIDVCPKCRGVLCASDDEQLGVVCNLGCGWRRSARDYICWCLGGAKLGPVKRCSVSGGVCTGCKACDEFAGKEV